MTSGKPSVLDSVGDAASGAGSEALAAISNLGGGDAGGTVGRIVSAVFGKHGGFAPKVITSVTKHGIAGVERVEPLSGVDRGYRAVAADANGLESIRTIIELDPRAYDVTVTREEGHAVVEFVQAPEPEPSVEPKPPVKRSGASGEGSDARADSSARTQSAAAGRSVSAIETNGSGRDEVAQARAEAEKSRAEAETAKAEAEAEKARAEAETARAEAETAKARARAERSRIESEGDQELRDTPELDGGTAVAGGSSTTSQAGLPTAGRSTDQKRIGADSGSDGSRIDAGTVAPTFGLPSVDGEASSQDAGSDQPSVTEVGPAGAGAGPPRQTSTPLDAETIADDADTAATVVDDGFGSFVAAEPVDEADESTVGVDESVDAEGGSSDAGDEPVAAEDESNATDAGSDTEAAGEDGGIGRWAGAHGDGGGETGSFEF